MTATELQGENQPDIKLYITNALLEVLERDMHSIKVSQKQLPKFNTQIKSTIQ